MQKLKQKISVGMEQLSNGQLTDGDVVFDRLAYNEK